MKILLAIGGFLLILLLGVMAWLIFFSPRTVPASPATTASFPQSQAPSAADIITQTKVKTSFLSDIQNSNQITTTKTIVVAPYALQEWHDENKGGEALLKYDVSSGWTLVSLGGGEWDVPSLEQEGVPADDAQQLVAKLSQN